MKKQTLIFLILTAMIFTSCGSLKVSEWDSGYFTTGYDFTEYSISGFLFTPFEYNGRYESIGLINVTLIPNVQRVEHERQSLFSEKPRFEGQRIVTDPQGYKYSVERPYTPHLIKQAFDEATAMGADAIITVSINYTTLQNGPIDIPTVRLSGFAIKRIN